MKKGWQILAVSLPLIACAIQFALWPYFKLPTWMTFYLAIVLAGWIGGLYFGLAATFLSLVLVWNFVIPLEQTLMIPSEHSITAAFFFTTIGILISMVHGRIHIAEQTLLRKNDELKIEKERLNLYFEHAPAGIAVFDNEMRYLAVSRRFLSDFEISAPDVIGKTLYEVFPEIPDRWRAVHRRCLAGAIEKSDSDEFIRADGAVDYVKWEMRPWYQAQGKIGGLILFNELITESKKTEMALLEIKERLQLAYAAANLGTVDWDIVKGKVLWSRETEKIWGLREGEFKGTYDAWKELVHPDDLPKAESIANRALQTPGVLYELEHRIRRPDGSVRWVFAKALTVWNSQNQPVRMVGINMDITERKRMEEDLRVAHEKLQNASARKDEFLATLSHELRTPLTSALMWAQMLRQNRLAVEQSTEAIVSIERSLLTQNQLIADLLDVSRIISGKIELEPVDTDLNLLIHQTVESVQPMADAKSVGIELLLDKAIGNYFCDPIRTKQVIWNLLTNAIKFSTPKSKVLVRSFLNKHYIKIQVTDQGKGIKPEFLPFIFERFSQEDSTTTRKFGGLGLGLSIVKDLVRLQGGLVSAESPGEGRGATFTITLPKAGLRASPVAPLESAEHIASGRDKSLAGVRVLVVDDSIDSRLVIKVALQSMGAEVKDAESAKEGLKLLQDYKPDVLLSDIAMPEEDGISFIRKIRQSAKEKGRDTPAIALTAYASLEDARKVMAAGFQAHLPKPIEIDKLGSSISALLKADRTALKVDER